MRGFHPLARVSTWRRVALHVWDSPGDPTVYGAIEIDVTEALDVVRELRSKSDVKVTLTHLVGRAVALAIRERPEVNAVLRLGRIYQREQVDVFFQVAFEGGENLGGHKVDHADEKSVVAIARELGAGAKVVREGRGDNVKATRKLGSVPGNILAAALKILPVLTYDLGLDLSRFGVPYDAFGSVMVTSVGSFGISLGFAPLVPFSRCPILLLVGEVQERAVVRDGAIVARPILPIGVTFDHRLLDGYQAGVLSKRFREVMENPRASLGEELA